MRALDLTLGPDALLDRELTQLRLRWLGTAGFELRCDGCVLLIDPYLTRAPLWRLLRPLQPDRRAIRRHVANADAIAVGHTHFDHVLDVPALAHRTGALVYGSRSAMALCRSAVVGRGQLGEIDVGDGASSAVRVGPFELDFALSEHSALVAGRVPFAGEIRERTALPQHAHQYRCGPVFRITVRVADRSIVHLGSAALPDGPPVGEPVDLLLLCAWGWHVCPELPERIMRRLAPRAIVLSHWDSFFRPLHRSVRQLPGLRLAALLRRLKRAGPGVMVGTLPPLGELRL